MVPDAQPAPTQTLTAALLAEMELFYQERSAIPAHPCASPATGMPPAAPSVLRDSSLPQDSALFASPTAETAPAAPLASSALEASPSPSATLPPAEDAPPCAPAATLPTSLSAPAATSAYNSWLEFAKNVPPNVSSAKTGFASTAQQASQLTPRAGSASPTANFPATLARPIVHRSASPASTGTSFLEPPAPPT